MPTNRSSDVPSAGPAVTVPFRTVLFSMLVLWATYFLLITVRSLIMDFGLQFELGWRRLLVTAIGVGFTLVLWLLLRLFDGRALWVKISAALLLALPVAMAIGQVNQWMFEDLQLAQERLYAKKYNINLRRDEAGNLLVDVPVRRVSPAAGPDQATGDDSQVIVSEAVLLAPAETYSDFWRRLLDVALGRYFLLLAWASTYFALLAGVQARSAERREQQFKSAANMAPRPALTEILEPTARFICCRKTS